jgi:hypothetical protein
VVDRNDPEQLGRVKFSIPGLIEPASPWAFPVATVGGGSKDSGFFAVPERGAEVYVFFVGGDIDEPRYFAGHWGITDEGSEVPEEARKTPPDNRVFATRHFRIELDESEGVRKLRLLNRRTGDFIELDAETNAITIQATTTLTLTATGLVDIRGTLLQLNGRPVLPGPKPI